MVVTFKIFSGKNQRSHDISRDNVEALLGRRLPWFRAGQQRGDDRHFAVCPYCETPIQLKGLYKRLPNSPRPYGSHTGTPMDGFAFNETDLKYCPYRLKNRRLNKDARKEMSAVSRELIHMAITEFDRIVLILRDDFGFRFSDKFALRMLDQWFDSQGYRYEGAHLRNLPWMIAYFGPTQNLFGQVVKGNEELCASIMAQVHGASLSDAGRLDKGNDWYRLDLQCLWHKIVQRGESAELTEQLLLRVKDFTKTNVPEQAPTIYEKVIVFNPERLEALMHVPADRAKRNALLLEEAVKLGEKWGYTYA